MELKVNGLIKRFGDFTAVDDVELLMTRGVYGLLGVNGAGKTTLMRMLCTLISPTEGNITCDGKDIYDMGASYRKLIGYLPQEFGYYPEFSVEDYLHYVAALKGIRPIVAQKRTKVLLEWTGLANVAKKKMKKLSGGMKRRAGIAQAMLNDPKILILDEPTAGLDPVVRDEILDLLREIIRDEDKTVFFSTHITSDLDKIADYIVLIESGRIAFNSEKDELIEEYRVIKGGMSALTPELKDKTLRYEESGYGFKGLIKAADIPRGDRGYVIERPNVEEIMLAKWKLDRGE